MCGALAQIFDQEKFPESFCQKWFTLHTLILQIIEKANYLILSAPKMNETRKFRGFCGAYVWILENIDEAEQVGGPVRVLILLNNLNFP